MIPELVSFDFDGTLQRSRWDPEWGWIDGPANENMISVLRDYGARGVRVYIVTARNEDMEMSEFPPGHPAHTVSVIEFVCKHRLPVEGVVFTNGDLKVDCLVMLGSDLHFDDSVAEIEALRARAPFIKTVRVRSEV